MVPTFRRVFCTIISLVQVIFIVNGEESIGRNLRSSVQCYDSLEWTTADGSILLNGRRFNMKGVNWSGFETPEHVVNGLWYGGTTIDEMLDFCQSIKVNTLRLPISLELALNPDTVYEEGFCVECDSDLAWDVLDVVFDKAADRGIVIILDMHNLNGENENELWFDDEYSEDDFIEGWANILNTFVEKKNFLGIDLLNEPHGNATWAMGEEYDWDVAAPRLVAAIVELVPSYNHLILIEGVESGGAPSPYPTWEPAYYKFWGSNLDGLYTNQVDLGDLDHLLVYSSHIYGPSLYEMFYFYVDEFPDNMPGIWDLQVGFVEGLTGKPLIIGEWGGQNVDEDAVLQSAWVEYMAENCIGDAIYWALNPNSGDLGGLLTDDWKTPHWDKVDLMEIAQPYPTEFAQPIGDLLCIDFGTHSCSATYGFMESEEKQKYKFNV